MPTRREFLKLAAVVAESVAALPWLDACTTPPTPDMSVDHLKDLEPLKSIPDVELIKLHIPDLNESEKVIIRGFLKGNGLDVDRFDQGNVEIWLPGTPDPSDPEKKKKKFLFAGVLRETNGKIDARLVIAGRMLVRHTVLQKNLDIPVFMQTGPDGRLVGVSLAQTLGPDELSSKQNRQRDYRIVRATLDEKGAVVPDPQQLILQYSVTPGFQGPSPTIVGTQVYALDMSWNNLTKPPLRIYGDTTLATEQQFAALTKPATTEYTSNLLSPSDAKIEKMAPTAEDGGLQEAAKKAGITVEKAVFSKVYLEALGGDRSKEVIVIFDPTKSALIVEGIALEGEYFCAVKRTSTSRAETTVNISLKDANLGTDGKSEYWEIKRLLPVFEREKKRIVFGDGDPLQLTMAVEVNDKGPVPVTPDKAGDLMVSGMAATFAGSVIVQLEKVLKLFGDGVNGMMPAVKEVKERVRGTVVLKKDIVTNRETLNQILKEYANPPNYPATAAFTFLETKDRFAYTIFHNVAILSISIEKNPDGKLVAYILYALDRLKGRVGFFKFAVPIENFIVPSFQSKLGIDNLSSSNEEEKLKTISSLASGSGHQEYISFTTPASKDKGIDPEKEAALYPVTTQYKLFRNKMLDEGSDIMTKSVSYTAIIGSFTKMVGFIDQNQQNGMDLLEVLNNDWVENNKIPEYLLDGRVIVQPYLLPKKY